MITKPARIYTPVCNIGPNRDQGGVMDDSEEGPLSAGALLKTMAVAALLASVVSACGKSLDKPALPKTPKPQTAAPAEVSHAIFSTKPGSSVFYLDGAAGRRGRLVIRT
jgi:hypothetical protein